MKLASLAAALLALTAAAPCALAQPDRPARPEQSRPGRVDLRPKLELGEKHRLSMTIDSASDIDYRAKDAEDVKQSITQEFTLLFRVVEADPDGGATAELVFERVKAEMDSPLGRESFDSSRPAERDGDSILAPAFRPIVGTTVTVEFDTDGNITSVRGGEGLALAASVGASAGGGAPSVKELIGGLFTVKKGDGFASVGESWTDVDRIGDSPVGAFKMTTEHTLKSVARNEANVTFKGRLDPDSEAAPGPVRIIEASYSGKYVWDTREGMLSSMDSEQSVSMEINAPGMEAVSHSRQSTRVKRTP